MTLSCLHRSLVAASASLSLSLVAQTPTKKPQRPSATKAPEPAPVPQPAASTGPSLEETQNFIINLLGSSAGEVEKKGPQRYGGPNSTEDDMHMEGKKSKLKIRFLNNKMIIEREIKTMAFFINGHRAGFGTEIYDKNEIYIDELMIDSLQPEVKINDNWIHINCNTGDCISTKKTIKANSLRFGEINTDDIVEQKASSIVYYQVRDSDTAQKFAKALSHLILLHGGKKSLF